MLLHWISTLRHQNKKNLILLVLFEYWIAHKMLLDRSDAMHPNNSPPDRMHCTRKVMFPRTPNRLRVYMNGYTS